MLLLNIYFFCAQKEKKIERVYIIIICSGLLHVYDVPSFMRDAEDKRMIFLLWDLQGEISHKIGINHIFDIK